MTHYKQLELDYNAPEMGETSFREDDYIVLSLHPEPYERILSGEKTYEYRTQFRKRPTIAFVYSNFTGKMYQWHHTIRHTTYRFSGRNWTYCRATTAWQW